MYTSPGFDTHKFVKSFTVTGMKEEQAEAIVAAIVESRDQDFSKLATKEQIDALKLQLDSFKDEMKLMATKEQLDALKLQLDSFKDEIKLMATKEQLDELKDEIKLMATKEQLDDLKDEIKLMATKEQMEIRIDNSISKLEASLLKWFITSAIAMTGIIIAAIKFIH